MLNSDLEEKSDLLETKRHIVIALTAPVCSLQNFVDIIFHYVWAFVF